MNGLDKFGAKPAGEEYWTFGKTTYEFVKGAKVYFNDQRTKFLPVKHNMSSCAYDRWKNGFDYAKEFFSDGFKLNKHETIKFVTHSMGAAYAEGMAAYLLEAGYPVSDLIHLNSFQTGGFMSVGAKYPTVNIIDYQNTDDKLINPIIGLFSQKAINGASHIIRESTKYSFKDSFKYSHTYPIDIGFKFWSELKKKTDIDHDKKKIK